MPWLVRSVRFTSFLMPGVTLPVRPDEGAPPGSGRLLVRSTSVASGYLGIPDEENDPFIDGEFLTGDYGLVDKNERLMLSGRASVAAEVREFTATCLGGSGATPLLAALSP